MAPFPRAVVLQDKPALAWTSLHGHSFRPCPHAAVWGPPQVAGGQSVSPSAGGSLLWNLEHLLHSSGCAGLFLSHFSSLLTAEQLSQGHHELGRWAQLCPAVGLLSQLCWAWGTPWFLLTQKSLLPAPAPGIVPVSGSSGFPSTQGRMILSVLPEGTLTPATDHSLPTSQILLLLARWHHWPWCNVRSLFCQVVFSYNVLL